MRYDSSLKPVLKHVNALISPGQKVRGGEGSGLDSHRAPHSDKAQPTSLSLPLPFSCCPHSPTKELDTPGSLGLEGALSGAPFKWSGALSGPWPPSF